MRHRPIGIGVQGLADAFILMRYPFESEEAQQLNKHIFESMYYSALKTSCELAKEEGPYETFPGSPASKGVCCVVYIIVDKIWSVWWFKEIIVLIMVMKAAISILIKHWDYSKKVYNANIFDILIKVIEFLK